MIEVLNCSACGASGAFGALRLLHLAAFYVMAPGGWPEENEDHVAVENAVQGGEREMDPGAEKELEKQEIHREDVVEAVIKDRQDEKRIEEVREEHVEEPGQEQVMVEEVHLKSRVSSLPAEIIEQ